MTIHDAVEKAVDQGYYVLGFDGVTTTYRGANAEWSVWRRTDNGSSFMVCLSDTFLDPAFWQAFTYSLPGVYPHGDWKILWHDFIEHLIDEGNADSFFAGLGASQPDTVTVACGVPTPQVLRARS
jgi:hypothetical protein